jgi:Ca2+-binding RTX toxin-like protein
VTVSLDDTANDGVDCPQQCEGDNVMSDIENITGSFGDDVLIGSDVANVIDAGYGNNTVDALAGNDIVRGGDEVDTVHGGAGDDSLHGGDGNDALDGGSEVDSCFGDDGTDTATACESQAGIP